jgi:uncharacterized membrane protein required for colicin V production
LRSKKEKIMALLDIVILVMAIGGGLLGWHRRFTGQLGSIAGVILGLVLCRVFAGNIVEYYTTPEDTAQTRLFHTVMAYVLVGAGSYLVVRVGMNLMRTMLRVLHLGIIDNIAGAAFNVFQWLLGLSMLLNLWLAIFPDSDLHTDNQGVVDCVIDLAPTVVGSETAKSILRTSFSGNAKSGEDGDEAQGTDNVEDSDSAL